MKEKVLGTDSGVASRSSLCALVSTLLLFACRSDPAKNSDPLMTSLKYGRYQLFNLMPDIDHTDSVSSYCEIFQLDDFRIRQFMSVANRITQNDLHDNDEYSISPCAIKGVIQTDKKQYNFRVMSSGIAMIWSQSDSLILECVKRCNKILTSASSGNDPK